MPHPEPVPLQPLQPLQPAPDAPPDAPAAHPPPPLYPAQSERVLHYLNSGVLRRGHFPWQTGTGKTVGACAVVNALHPLSILIVCPAVVRVHWQREVERWCGRVPAVVSLGRKAKAASKAKHHARLEAYNASIQIVSYDLLGEVTVAPPWDLIILDELHHLAAPKSAQSKRAARLIAANPQAHVLGLTATLIPTEVKQLWNPMRLIYGERAWGEPSETGDVCKAFLRTYCEAEVNEYGATYSGCRSDMRERLQRRLERLARPLSREDIASSLPPLDLHTLALEGDAVGAAVNWAEAAVASGVKKLVLLFHKRETAFDVLPRMKELHYAGFEFHHINGAVPPGIRTERLDMCEKAERVILIGTYGALAEGVRLMWAEQVLIDEWSMSPGRLLQVLGRFQSVGSGLRPCVSLRTHAGNWSDAARLAYRISAMQGVLGDSAAVSQLEAKVAAHVDAGGTATTADWLAMFESQVATDETDETDGESADAE